MGTAGQSAADTLLGALTQAYQVNPQLNAQRAIVRQADEAVPQALSGYRPSVKVNAGVGKQITSQETIVGPAGIQKDLWPTTPSSVGITV
ncbi:MAG: TolC family protein, partial [Xanthobacteraceae bacterium]